MSEEVQLRSQLCKEINGMAKYMGMLDGMPPEMINLKNLTKLLRETADKIDKLVAEITMVRST